MLFDLVRFIRPQSYHKGWDKYGHRGVKKSRVIWVRVKRGAPRDVRKSNQ